MENRYKIRIAITITALATISILFAARLRRRRQKQKSPRISCYLHSDPKPQLSFKRILADNSLSRFKHLKFNAEESSSCAHPYESEISGLIENPGLKNVFDMEVKPEFKARDSYVWVETESQLKQVADTLSTERVFGVDTEQHSFRSFHGFTALIQISTESQDYLLDTIALHDVMRILAPVFADPRICKVFHGADNDVLWLQRDFHIYVVNLFDTAKACEVLSKPQKSLAYLLETYCGVATNKLLQREDWRQRPLSMEMLEYAQIDAHYLLYIAHCLIAELKQENDGSTYLEAIRRSNTICFQLYSKEIEGYLGNAAASSILYRLLNGQKGSSISSETQDLVRRLCTWRDLMARVHDESLRYVLSDQAIMSLAVEDPTTPSEICDIIAQADTSVDPMNFGSSLPSPSPVVCSHLDDFCCLIQDKTSNLNNFSVFLQMCLGKNGSCPLSVYNYALLVNYDLGVTNSKRNGFKNSKQPAKKASRELFVQKFSCKSPVYHNCRIYANDGRLLCYCDRRKLEWYLRRDLAKLVDENPPAIMLLFEPKGRPEDEGSDFYIQSKKNMCVGCGEGNHYLRYRIIPSCYRMHFPEHLKSHRSHDIVLLCVDCHEVAHAAAEKYKREVAAEFRIPLFVKKVCDSKEVPIIPGPYLINVGEAGVPPLHLRTAAMALLRHGSRMPPERREELTQVVMKFYGGREVSEEDLERALLVGMSPHEKRRHRKKRRSSLKHSNGCILPNKMLLETADSIPTSAVEYIIEDQEYCTAADTDKSGICSDVTVDREVSTTPYNNMHPHGNGVFPTDVIGNAEEDSDRIPSNTPDGIGNPEEDSDRLPSNTHAHVIGNAEEDSDRIPSNTPDGIGNPEEDSDRLPSSDVIGNAEEDSDRIPSNTPDGIGNPEEDSDRLPSSDVIGNAEEDSDRIPSNNPDLGQSSHDGNAQPKTRSKVSLLGHGPHGEKVVDCILKDYGEAGIHQFCQRWRQIFVEAINPRFLPAGWDVMHSGKRDFGEFSVYNPVNKASDPQS